MGDSHAGKSALLTAFAAEEYDPAYTPTVGVDFKSRTVRIDDGDGYSNTVKLTLWDSAGASSSALARDVGCLVAREQAFTRACHRIRPLARRGGAELSSDSEHVLQRCPVRCHRLRCDLAEILPKRRTLDVRGRKVCGRAHTNRARCNKGRLVGRTRRDCTRRGRLGCGAGVRMPRAPQLILAASSSPSLTPALLLALQGGDPHTRNIVKRWQQH